MFEEKYFGTFLSFLALHAAFQDCYTTVLTLKLPAHFVPSRRMAQYFPLFHFRKVKKWNILKERGKCRERESFSNHSHSPWIRQFPLRCLPGKGKICWIMPNLEDFDRFGQMRKKGNRETGQGSKLKRLPLLPDISSLLLPLSFGWSLVTIYLSKLSSCPHFLPRSESYIQMRRGPGPTFSTSFLSKFGGTWESWKKEKKGGERSQQPRCVVTSSFSFSTFNPFLSIW